MAGRVWSTVTACGPTSEGKTTREAIRCLERYLARRVSRRLQPPTPVEKSLNLLT
jgi:hypothetical protein